MPFDLPTVTVEMMTAFLLMFFRATGIMMSAPLFTSTTFPMQLRVWFALWIAAVCFPLVTQRLEPGFFTAVFRSDLTAAVAVLSELTIGWAIGFICSIVVWSAQVTGHLLGQEIGLSIGEIFDPISETASSPTSNLVMTLAVLVFVVMDGHRLVLMGLIKSVDLVPPGRFLSMSLDTCLAMVRDLGGTIWLRGVQLALPIVLALLLATVCMAILARTVPEMNIFMLGFSLRIGIGLFAALAIIPFLIEGLAEMVLTTEVHLSDFLKTLAGGGRG